MNYFRHETIRKPFAELILVVSIVISLNISFCRQRLQFEAEVCHGARSLSHELMPATLQMRQKIPEISKHNSMCTAVPTAMPY